MCLYASDIVPGGILLAIYLVLGLVPCRSGVWRWVLKMEDKRKVGMALMWPMVAVGVAGTWKLLHDWFVRPVGSGWCLGLLGLFLLSLGPAAVLTLGMTAEGRRQAQGADEFEPWTWRGPWTLGLAGTLVIVLGFVVFGR